MKFTDTLGAISNYDHVNVMRMAVCGSSSRRSTQEMSRDMKSPDTPGAMSMELVANSQDNKVDI